MISSMVRWSVLVCAGWGLFGDAVKCPAQPADTVYKLYERARAAAETGDPERQFELGKIYEMGLFGAARNGTEAVKWYRKAAAQEHADAQQALGRCHANAIGVTKNFMEAAAWYRKAAEQGNRTAQFELGYYYRKGYGVSQDLVESYKWYRLAAINGEKGAGYEVRKLDERMTRQQVARAEMLVLEFNKQVGSRRSQPTPALVPVKAKLRASGIGFFISEDGYLVTSSRVVKQGGTIRLQTSQGEADAKLVRMDDIGSVAILKAEGRFPALPLISSRGVRLGSKPIALGLPPEHVQTLSPEAATVEVARLTGAQDDARFFEIGVPSTVDVSGGALLDEHGNLIGLMNSERNPKPSLLPSNLGPGSVGFALKSSFLLSFLESLPEVLSQLKQPDTSPRSTEEITQAGGRAVTRVLVY